VEELDAVMMRALQRIAILPRARNGLCHEATHGLLLLALSGGGSREWQSSGGMLGPSPSPSSWWRWDNSVIILKDIFVYNLCRASTKK